MTNRTSYLKWLCGFALAFVLSIRCTPAWIRGYAHDDELVQRSDSIVIGHIEGGFTQFEYPSKHSDGYHYWEYRTTLFVTQTISGKVHVGPTPLVIHYGIKPVILKTNPSLQDTFNPPAADQNTDSNTPVGIYDAATTIVGMPPGDNIRKDHVWLLRTSAGSIGGVEEDTSAPGIWSPQDVQSLDRKSYYEAVLSGNIDAITPFTVGDSDVVKQARNTVSRLAVEKISQIPDLSKRCDQLLPFFLKKAPASNLAFEEIIACGSVGAAKLIPTFENSPGTDKTQILIGWKNAEFKGSVPLIIEWLTKEDRWWGTLTKDDQIFASREGPKGGAPYNDPRSVSFRNICCSIEALGNFRAKESKALILQIRNRWQAAAPFDPNNDFLKVCDDALASFQ
jgi:hypothetical protein